MVGRATWATTRGEAEAKFQELAQAVNVLTNPERRKNYDFELSLAHAPGVPGESDAIAQDYIAQPDILHVHLTGKIPSVNYHISILAGRGTTLGEKPALKAAGF